MSYCINRAVSISPFVLPLTIRFAIPEGFALQRISALGARVTTAQESEGRVLAVTLASDVSADVSVQMAF